MNSSPALDRVTGGRIIARKKRFGGVRFGLAKGFRHQFISKPLTFSPYNGAGVTIAAGVIMGDYDRWGSLNDGMAENFSQSDAR